MNEAGVDFMITGSVASSLQGEPRSTHDLDVVVAISEAAIPKLRAAFPPSEFYLDESATREAIQTGGMFNVIELQDGDKVDFRLLTDAPFDQSRFGRKYEEDVFGIRLEVSTPEDTILQKLRWAQMASGSEKAFLDALRVYEVQHDRLDRSYIREWVDRLGIEALWERIQAEAEEV